jgi:hypothetical protein
VAFFVSFWALLQSDSILRATRNGTYSLGKSQSAFWGLVVALSFLGVWLVIGQMERIAPQVLILMGIGAATGLGSVIICNSNIAGGIGETEDRAKGRLSADPIESDSDEHDRWLAAQKLDVPRERHHAFSSEVSRGFWRDICDDGNGLSFRRMQVVIWSVILGLVFIRSVSQVMTMPEFPETLLVLMGISSGTYLGLKIPEKRRTQHIQ